MQQQYSGSYIPTIRQVHRDLKEAYIELDQAFKEIGMIPLSREEDLEPKKVTLKKVLASIPTEEELEAKLRDATTHDAKLSMAKYAGTNELILKAKENYNEIKKQQKKIYYLASQFSMASVSPEFKDKVDANLQGFHSFRDVSEVKRTKTKALEKNSISESYFEEGHSELDNKNEPVVKVSKKSQELKNLDLLVHVNFYDSHNSEKQYEFICVEEQNLGSLVEKFRCLVDTLRNLDRLRKKPDNDMENYEIYDKFYQPAPGRNSKSHAMGRAESASSSLKYLLMEDTIYYEGNKMELEPLLNAYQGQKKGHCRCLEISRTKLSDMRVVFGRPYLYRHLGGCDHIVIFKEARLFVEGEQGHDISQMDRYPLTVYESKMKRRKCEGCGEYFSEVVGVGDALKNGENLYLCEGCHKDLHLDEKGKLKHDDKIKIISYIHD